MSANLFSSKQVGDKYPVDYSHPFKMSHSVKWLNTESKIFCIGSCFAKNISTHLQEMGIFALFNDSYGLHYNPSTVLDEFRRINGEEIPRLTWSSKKSEETTIFFDAFRNKVFSRSLEDLENKRTRIDQLYRSYFDQSDSFIITLGLAEVWEQNISQGDWKIINRAPIADAFIPDKFRNRFLSVAECKKIINDIITLIQTTKGENTPIIFTVSPIPLKTTSSGNDPRVANNRSKSILLSALHEVLELYSQKKVNYFPSYEFFIAANLPPMFKKDSRHPLKNRVKKACDLFTTQFFQ